MALKQETLTPLGYYLAKKPVSKSKLGRMTGITKDRVGNLCNNIKSKPTIEEVYLIGLAVDGTYEKLMEYLCDGIELRPESEWDVTNAKEDY
ncbi:hypothetical protein [Parapedobacter koreensis]|nr:hypothetical protein [Parapedobacter koreensis]